MKQEELIKTLIKELMKTDEVHYEYTENNNSYVLDSTKDNNTLTIKVSIKENKDKENFEKWLKTVDDSLFSEVLDELSDDIPNLNEEYQSGDFKKVISQVKAKTKEIALRKIKELNKVLQ